MLALVATPGWIKQKLTNTLDSEQFMAQPLIAYDEDLLLIQRYFKQMFEKTLKVQVAVTVVDLRMVRPPTRQR